MGGQPSRNGPFWRRNKTLAPEKGKLVKVERATEWNKISK
jgi:hypothetical protein